MVKCDACDNVYTGKTAVKTLARHYRAVHQEPKKKDEQDDDIIEKCEEFLSNMLLSESDSKKVIFIVYMLFKPYVTKTMLE